MVDLKLAFESRGTEFCWLEILLMQDLFMGSTSLGSGRWSVE